MSRSRLLVTNLTRRKVRTTLTLLSIVVAFLLYGMLAAVRNAFTGGVELAGVDRLMVMNKASFLQPLPRSYEKRIAEVEGVRSVTHATYVEAYYREPTNYVVALAVDAESYLALYREILLVEPQRRQWIGNQTGAAVGRNLAERFGWKVGDRITLISAANDGPGWELSIDGMYDVEGDSVDTGALLMHYRYLNESRLTDRDTVWSYAVAVVDPEQAGLVAQRIDRLFENSPAETKTWTEKAIVQVMVAQFGNIGAIVVAVATTMFFTMLLVTGSTISESVQERRAELAVLKAIGFTHDQVLRMIFSESLVLVGLGAGVGLALAYLVNAAIAVLLAQNLPLYGIGSSDVLLGLGMALVFALIVGWVPAQTGYRLSIARTLRAE